MKKKQPLITYDPATQKINTFLLKFPGIGSLLSRIYLWKFLTFNFMLVGASGMILSFLLYEGFLRIVLSPFPGGTFLGMLVTTLIVFLWNYIWNKSWSLGVGSQLLMMKKDELMNLKENLELLLDQKFDHKGERLQ